MSERFNWNTEEDNWDGIDQPQEMPGPRNRKRLLSIAILMAALIIVGIILFVKTRQSLDEVENTHIADIISSFQLINQSIIEQDKELFVALLSGSDFHWAEVNQELFEQDLLTDRRIFGLAEEPENSKVVDVTINPELNSAEVTIDQIYARTDSESSFIELQNVLIFRKGERWLWSPPRDDFWGGSMDEETTGRYLDILYPARDSEIARQLHGDLDQLIGSWCRHYGKSFCDDLHIQLGFNREPDSLLVLANQFFLNGFLGEKLFYNGRSYTLSLPTPTLVGLPKDEAGYKAIQKGYAAYLISALAAEIESNECCADRVLNSAQTHQQLAELDISPFRNDRTMEIKPSSADNELQLICQDGFKSSSRLVTYNIGLNEWQLVAERRHFVDLRRMPNGEGVLLLEKVADDGHTRVRVSLRQHGEEYLLFDMELTDEKAELVNWQLQERENRLILELPNMNGGANTFHNFDLSSCAEGSCPTEVHDLLSRPIWSPSGDNLLVRQYGMIWRQQGFQATPLAEGMAPFWIDSQAFGFVRRLGDEDFVFIRENSSKDLQPILNTSDLNSVLDDGSQPNAMSIGHISVNPVNSNIWIILAFGISAQGGAEDAYLFQWNRRTEDLSLIINSDKLHSFSLSPDGERLSASIYDADSFSWFNLIHEFDSGNTVFSTLDGSYAQLQPPIYEWSPDGKWLSAMSQGQLTLIDVSNQMHIVVSPPDAGCTRAVWAIN